MTLDLTPMLWPRSLAIVGASPDIDVIRGKLSRFAADHADRIEEIDLNPVIVHAAGHGVSVVDALIVPRR